MNCSYQHLKRDTPLTKSPAALEETRDCGNWRRPQSGDQLQDKHKLVCVTTSKLDMARDSDCIRGLWSGYRYWTDLMFVLVSEGSMNVSVLVNQENEGNPSWSA